MLNYIVWLNVLFAATLHRSAHARLFIVTGVIVAIMLAATLLPPGPWRSFLTNPMQLEFAAGVIVAALVTDPRLGRWIQSHPIWPVTLLGFSCLVVATLSDLSGGVRVLACGAAAAVTVFGLAAQDMHRSPFKAAGLWRMGKLSYAIYLVHPLVIPVVGVLLLETIREQWLVQLLMFAAVLSITVAGAHIAYWLVEKPANEWLRRRMGVAPKPGAAQLHGV
jgi:exopolysaccharide production protein ExoZ